MTKYEESLHLSEYVHEKTVTKNSKESESRANTVDKYRKLFIRKLQQARNVLRCMDWYKRETETIKVYIYHVNKLVE